MGLQEREAGQRQDRRALCLRDPAQRPANGAHRAAARQESGADGDHRAGPHGRCRAIRKAHGNLRFRYGGRGVRTIPVARQRAARVLGLPGGRRAGQPQPIGHQERGHRRIDRGADPLARSRQPRRPYPGARSGLAVRLLRHPELPSVGVLGGLLGQIPPPDDLAQIRHRPRHLVGRPQGRTNHRGKKTHLTLPSLRDGPLPLPPEGRRGDYRAGPLR